MMDCVVVVEKGGGGGGVIVGVTPCDIEDHSMWRSKQMWGGRGLRCNYMVIANNLFLQNCSYNFYRSQCPLDPGSLLLYTYTCTPVYLYTCVPVYLYTCIPKNVH